MIENAPPVHLRRLLVAHGIAVALAVALPTIALAVRGGGVLTPWVGVAVVAAVAIFSGFAVRYLRRRPIDPGDWGLYTRTVRARIGVGLLAAIAGTVFSVVTGSAWVAVFGALGSLIALFGTSTSDADYRRHQELAVEFLPPPPEEVWGTADPNELTPWAHEHGRHDGHHH